jgi:hypothetical protein
MVGRCVACRYWAVDPADGHQPRWGVCLRPGAPNPPFAVVAQDRGAGWLRTSPTFGCTAWTAE